MSLEKKSPCKVNLLLNILGKRADGFHELETVMYPIPVHDLITFEKKNSGIELTCNESLLPVDSKNLVYRAAQLFFSSNSISSGMKIHLEKKIPLAAGLGGGSGNAATTLLALNEMFNFPSAQNKLTEMAASLGSDIPFFLQKFPALATGRGEKVEPLGEFSALKNCFVILVHPGFGISTPWAYQQLQKFPAASNGIPGRAKNLISLLKSADAETAAKEFYNSLEAPALKKFPLLVLFQEFFMANGAIASLMSGSGSTTFAIIRGEENAAALLEKFKAKFGENLWTAVALLSGSSQN